MTKVTINYLGQLEQFAGRPSDTREFRARIRLPDLLAELAGHYGEDFRRMVMDEAGRPRASLLIVMNGEAINRASDPEFKDGDEVTLLPPIAGG